MRVLLVELDAKRHVERFQTQTRKVITQLLNPPFVPDGRMRIGTACGGLGGVSPTLAVHVIQVFGFRVISLEVLVRDRPRRGHTAVVPQLCEILLPQPEESRAVEFRIPPHVIVCVRVKWLAGLVSPNLLRLIFALNVYGPWTPVVLLPRDIIATFEEQDSLTQGSERVRKGSPAGAGADDDDVELFFSNQVSPPKT